MTQPDFEARNKVDALLRERKDALTVRWLVASAAIGVCAGVLAIVDKAVPDQVPPAVAAGAPVLGAVLAVLSVLVPRRMLRDPVLAEHLRAPIDPHRSAARMKLTSAQTTAFLALPPEEQKVVALTLVFERPYTVGLVLSCGVALVGLGYGIAIRGLLEATPYLLAALALNGWHYPRLSGLVDRGRVLQKVVQEQDNLRELANMEQLKQLTPSSRPPANQPPPAKGLPPRKQPALRKPRPKP